MTGGWDYIAFSLSGGTLVWIWSIPRCWLHGQSAFTPALCCRQWRTTASLGSWFLQSCRKRWKSSTSMGRITNKQWSRVTIDFPTRLRKKEMYWKKQHWPGSIHDQRDIVDGETTWPHTVQEYRHHWFSCATLSWFQSMHASLVKCSFLLIRATMLEHEPYTSAFTSRHISAEWPRKADHYLLQSCFWCIF